MARHLPNIESFTHQCLVLFIIIILAALRTNGIRMAGVIRGLSTIMMTSISVMSFSVIVVFMIMLVSTNNSLLSSGGTFRPH